MNDKLLINDNYIWNLNFLTKFLIRTVESYNHTQYILRFTLLFAWIELTTISGRYGEVTIGIYNLFIKFGLGTEGTLAKVS